MCAKTDFVIMKWGGIRAPTGKKKHCFGQAVKKRGVFVIVNGLLKYITKS